MMKFKFFGIFKWKFGRISQVPSWINSLCKFSKKILNLYFKRIGALADGKFVVIKVSFDGKLPATTTPGWCFLSSHSSPRIYGLIQGYSFLSKAFPPVGVCEIHIMLWMTILSIKTYPILLEAQHNPQESPHSSLQSCVLV